MASTALEITLRRDRLIVGAALAALTFVSWLYILWLVETMDMGMTMPAGDMTSPMQDAAPMSDMAMSDMAMGETVMAGLHPWSFTYFVFMFVMWAVMMVGMMTPSAAPMILIYARVGRAAEEKGRPLAATGFFAGGYLLAWTAFSLIATLGQWALEQALLLTPMMASASALFSGLVLIAAGLFQWTPQKDACLSHCQAPLAFVHAHGGFRREPLGALALGFHHGLYCIGCCWALMALLFVGGVMNVLWIAAIAIFVLAEKLLPPRWPVSRVAGGVLIALGIWVLAGGAL
ncbi:MAG: DUF2182 domain-containing protein [Nitratireductor sp.]|uniref:DUF2182 domain-containing protein n=1 Tax=Nitratireductor sp. TaxID=1872084 RepID=UPI00261AA4CD|nr:DUF2182 domain-containing protein [Nitratireductor sp.]MCV0350824.1 DUF2182 domain-containing protein [Nitratireductor sp.]